MEIGKMVPATKKAPLPAQALLIPDILLVIQFLLGMYINLYIKFPQTGPRDAWRFAWHTIPVIAHILLGTIILIAATITLIGSIRQKNRHLIIYGGIGTAAMLLSVIMGETFITTQNDIASYFMSVGFLTGILALNYGVLTN